MRVALAALRLLRGRLHDRAFSLHSQGRSEAAHALWAVVEELDVLINDMTRRR